MFSKKKCPHCGVRNLKETMTCSNCGAVFDAGQTESRISEEKAGVAPKFSTTAGEQREPTHEELIAWYASRERSADKERLSMRNSFGSLNIYGGLLLAGLFFCLFLAGLILVPW